MNKYVRSIEYNVDDYELFRIFLDENNYLRRIYY